MLKAQSLLAGKQIHRPKSGRKPLQPKNFRATPIKNQSNPNKLKPEWIDISLIDESNKENRPIYYTPTKIEIEPSFDSSLAEELSAIREKLERLRLDKEKTENLLKERDLMIERNLNEIEKRGEVQKKLEIELDRLYRLKQLKDSCMRVSPIRSLREKERGRKMKGDQSQEIESENKDELKEEETAIQIPIKEIDDTGK